MKNMKKWINLLVMLVSFVAFLGSGCATMTGVALSGDVNGAITNFDEVKQYLSSDSYVEIMEYPPKQRTTVVQYDHATYRGGKLISGSVTKKTSYPSAMARCALLGNGDFSLHATALRPGTYFIAVQPIAGFMPAILKDSQGHAITVVVSSNTQFPLNLGAGVLSLEREGGPGGT